MRAAGAAASAPRDGGGLVEPAGERLGRWNENTGRLAASGSSRFVNRVSVPVDS